MIPPPFQLRDVILDALDDALIDLWEARQHRGRQLHEDAQLILARTMVQVGTALKMWAAETVARVGRMRAYRTRYYPPQMWEVCGDTKDGSFCRLRPGHSGKHRDGVTSWESENEAGPKVRPEMAP